MKPGRTYVLDPHEDARVPFLRGILTRSLQNCGLDFQRAYAIADALRTELEGVSEIRVAELKERVVEALEARGLDDVRAVYLHCPREDEPVVIRDRKDRAHSFSQDILASSIHLCAIPHERTVAIARQIEGELRRRRPAEASSLEVARRVYELLGEAFGEERARRYLRWIEFRRSGISLQILIGGSTGTGKSTVSAEVAHRLGIVRTQSTDMLREVMRLLIPRHLLPGLHVSSYQAWRTLPRVGTASAPTEDQTIEGFLTQSRQVSVAVDGVVQRAAREGVSIIVEGVHMIPERLQAWRGRNDVLAIAAIVAVLRRSDLKQRLQGRALKVRSRRAERYLENFDAIWLLQSHLLSEADRCDIPIVTNTDLDVAVSSLLALVGEALQPRFEGDPRVVLA